MKRTLSFVLALVLLIGLMPQFALPVWATEESAEFDITNLHFDDHVDLSGKTVEIIDAGTPTSYQVGYGVEENAVLDTAVVTMDGDTLVATGIGNALIKVDGEEIAVNVTAAPISLLLLIGQSNMRGSEGNADQSIVCPDGMVYATFGDDRGDAEGIMNVNNATNFAASALTGEYSTINVNGNTDNLSYYPINSLTEAGKGTFGPDSGFAYEWVKQTGEKVWVVNAAHGGSGISSWQPNATNFKEAVALFSACQETLRKEITAGHFTLSHMGYFWCQGCNDVTMTAEQYVTKYLAMHDGLNISLGFDHDSNEATSEVTFEFAGIIPILYGVNSYRAGEYKDTNTYTYYQSFEQLTFNGPRVAQYWMCNNPELEDIWMVCNIGEDWVWMPDGTNGVSAYFQSHYANGTVDYTTQVAQKASWYTPTTPAAVHDSIHYNQIGYNEIGRESTRNALIMLGEIEAPEVETTVELLSWDGYTSVNKISASLVGKSGTLIVPKIYPVWKSKDVSYTLTDGFTWSYYDVLTSDEGLTGALTMGGQTVIIDGHNWSAWETLYEASAAGPGKEERVCYHCGNVEAREIDGVWQIYKLADHLLELPEDVCCGTNLWAILPHEDVHFTSGKTWGRVSTPAPSVTIPINAGDRIYATSFLAKGDNGGPHNGIRLTFFDANGVAWSVDPTTAYKEWAKNGYIEAPAGTIAANIPMWYDSEDYELYILNREHSYTPTVTAPTCTEQGYTTYTCVCGDSFVDDYVDATGEHTWGNWAELVAPTCDAEGTDRRICETCSEEQYRDTRITGDPNRILVSTPVAKDFYTGKKIVFLGDSVTWGSFIDTVRTDAYPYVVGSSLGATVSNKAVSGSSICTDGHVTVNETLTENNIKGASVVTILLGVNDFNHAVKNGIWQGNQKYDKNASYYDLGDYNSTNTSEFYGALRAWCEQIAEFKKMPEYENTQFIFITMPISAMNRSINKVNDWDQSKTNIYGHTLREYCTAIMEICAEYDIPVFDANMFSGIYYNSAEDNNVDITGGDGVHPTAAGHALIAESLEEFLLEGYTYEARSVKNGGHNYVNGSCTNCQLPKSAPTISQQPESVQQEIGKKFAITVKAEGEGLTYQWYYKDAGMKNFGVSSNKTSSYAYTMQTYMHNRQVYCVITDAYGNQVTTETATITRPPVALKITEQPQDAQVNVGEKFSISPKVEGEGLTYQWYVKESGAKAFKVSSNKTSAYAYTMQSYMIGRQVYCVITDKYGNEVTTDVATISLPPVELKLLSQTNEVYTALGEKFSVSFEVQGDGLTYQWYYKNAGGKTFAASSNKTSAYAYTAQSYMNNRQVYCVITDQYGNQVTTETVTIHVNQ